MFKIEEEKDREKEKVRQQAGEPQREKQLQPRTKPIEFHYKNTYFFHSPRQKCLPSQIKRPFPPSPFAMLFTITQEMHT